MSSRKLQIGIAVVVALIIAGFFFLGGLPIDLGAPATPALSSGLVVQDEVVGTGAEAMPGSIITINYTGKLENGTVFDTSVGRPPQQFPFGFDTTMSPWEQGVQGMKVGGKRLIIIPPELGYGAEGRKDENGNVVIPPNATLVFEIELLGVTPLPEGSTAQ